MMYLLIKQSENEALREGEEEGIIKIIKERLMPSLQGEMSFVTDVFICVAEPVLAERGADRSVIC